MKTNLVGRLLAGAVLTGGLAANIANAQTTNIIVSGITNNTVLTGNYDKERLLSISNALEGVVSGTVSNSLGVVTIGPTNDWYLDGSNIRLTATPNNPNAHVFQSWSGFPANFGSVTNINPIDYSLVAGLTNPITPKFGLVSYSLTVETRGGGFTNLVTATPGSTQVPYGGSSTQQFPIIYQLDPNTRLKFNNATRSP